jgi:hypothetical protein
MSSLKIKVTIMSLLIGLVLAGCGTGTPIVAGAVDTVGVAIGGGAQDQGVNLTVGYKGAKFAVVPVQTAQGKQLSLYDGRDKEKGFSVFAMLGLDAKAPAAPGVGVEQVVAVGPAADIWAAGRSRVTPEQLRAAGLIP